MRNWSSNVFFSCNMVNSLGFLLIIKRCRIFIHKIDSREDREETLEQPSSDEIKSALERLKARKEKYEELSSRIEKEGEISTVDSDARMMRSGGDGRELDVCYSVPRQTHEREQHN